MNEANAQCGGVTHSRALSLSFSRVRCTCSADDPAANLAQAFQLAEDYFGIERILDVEDVTSQVKPDEKIVLTYVAFFFKGCAQSWQFRVLFCCCVCVVPHTSSLPPASRFADYLRRAGLARAICKAIDITRRHDAWIEEYTTKATELQAWTAETTAQFQSRDHGNTADLVKETLVAFNQYVELFVLPAVKHCAVVSHGVWQQLRTLIDRYKADVQPGYKATKGQLEGVYNTLCASARNNNRPLFQPEAGLTQEDINTSWAVCRGSVVVWMANSLTVSHTLEPAAGPRGSRVKV